MKVADFQAHATKMLRSMYSDVVAEWSAFGNQQDLYSPRVDIAVGPFSVVPGGNCIKEYDQLVDESAGFLQRLIDYHTYNLETYRGRSDPRIWPGL